MHTKNFLAAGFFVLPLFAVLGNGCTVHETAFNFGDGGLFGDYDGSTSSDGGKKSDGSTSKDAQATTDSPATGVCAPGDVSGLTATFHPPTAFHQGACTPTQVSAFIDCLSGLPDANTCKTFVSNAANKTCIACAATPSTAASYGPLVEGTVTINVNVAGCIARTTNDLTATGCGAKIEANTECQQLACETNCPVSATDTGAEFNALLKCQDDSETSVCASYATAAGCADGLIEAGTAAQCANGGSTFSDNANAMVTLFCGN
ncbi:MAG: hypothetical protein ABIP39_16800 [Polyangiaceae bacterium]